MKTRYDQSDIWLGIKTSKVMISNYLGIASPAGKDIVIGGYNSPNTLTSNHRPSARKVDGVPSEPFVTVCIANCGIDIMIVEYLTRISDMYLGL